MSKKKNPLFDPNHVLTGKQLGKAATAATRLEYKPIIRAHTRELKMIARQRAREQRGLAKLGKRTTQQMNATYRRLNQGMNAASQSAGQIGQGLQDAAASSIAAGNERMDTMQSNVFSNQAQSRADANIPQQGIPGQSGSASENALAKAMAERAAMSSASNEGLQGVANAQSTGMQEIANNRAAAAKMQQAQGINSARSAIMSRRLDSRAAYGDAQTEVRDSLRTARGLRGATKLNNIMRLRDTERGFKNERAAMMLDARMANQANQLGYAKIKEAARQHDNPNDGGGGGGGGDRPEPEDRPKKMLPRWYNEWKAAADQVRGDVTIEPGYWQNFLDRVEDKKDPGWSAVQRNKFLKQYKQYVNKTN